MRAGLIVLPFLALLISAIGTAVSSAFPETTWISAVAWAVAASLVALWVVLDFDSFKLFFTRKGAKYGASSGLIVILGVGIVIGVAVLTARPRFNKSIDLTRDRLNTLSDQSLKILETLKERGEPVSMSAFFMDDQVSTQFRDLVALYEAHGAAFKIDYINPQADPTRAMAEKITDGNTVVIRYGNQEKRLNTFNEEKLSNALVNVLKEKSKKIYFTKGHGEGAFRGTDATGFSTIVQELENNKYEIQELSLLETGKIPDDANMVVIAGPKYDIKDEEIVIFEDYLKKGGAMLVMVDAMAPVEKLNSLGEKFGFKFQNDFLILPPNDIRAQMLGQNNAIVSEFDDFSPVTRDFASQSAVVVMMRNTRSLQDVADNPNKLKVTLAAKTANINIKVKNVSSAKDLEGLTEDRWEMGSYPVMAVAAGKTQLAMAANTKVDEASKTDVNTNAGSQTRETRLVAVGSSQFASNSGAQQSSENRDLFMNMTGYLLQDEDFIAIRPKDPMKTTLNLTTGNSQVLLLFLSFIYPLVFLGGGTVVWLRRRRA